MKRVIFILMIALVLVPGTAWAQDATPEAAEDHSQIVMLGESNKVIFPHSIWMQTAFTFTDQRIERIARLFFTYTLPNGRIVTVDVDPALYVTDASWGFNVVYTYTPNDPAALPDPMTTIPYTWTLTLDDGATGTVEGEFFYADARFEWEPVLEEWMTLYTYTESVNISFLQRALRTFNEQLRIDSQSTPLFRFVLYEPGDDYCEDAEAASSPIDPALNPLAATLSALPTSALPTPAIDFEATRGPTRTPTPTPPPATPDVLPLCRPEEVEQLYRAAGIIPLRRHTYNMLELQSDIAREMAEQTWRDLWGTAKADMVPAWFVDGLAQLYEPRAHAAEMIAAESAVRSGTEFSLAAMSTLPSDADEMATPTGFTPQIDPWHAQSVSMVLFLVDEYGPDAHARVARAIVEQDSFDLAMIDQTGFDAAENYARWREWISRPVADELRSWHPYLPPSPTPTLSRTPLPTFTPSIAPAATETPFPTQFGVPAQGAPVPFDPTPVPTPRPPTNTPRPPATNTPGHNGFGGMSGSTLLALGIGLGLVLVVLMVVGLIIMKRTRRTQ